jgi:(1->4)-alpha-D-glucan 1-alpha-D-glucosylmutase
MRDLFQAEIRVLVDMLMRISEDDTSCRDLEPGLLRRAIVEVAACLPVYRTYVRGYRVSRRDRGYVERAVADAARRNPGLPAAALALLRRVLLLELPPSLPPARRRDWLRFVLRWQQFTGPVMAKGVEDTSLYVYNRLISLNEVGSDPADWEESIGIAQFHRRNRARRRRWPHTLNATSTHDTKRGEDVRARINVLGEMPQEWSRHLAEWSRLNAHLKWRIDGEARPDANEETLIYQTLLGAWPLGPAGHEDLVERLTGYIVKAGREAKVHTSWLSPNEEHEAALVDFIEGCLDRRRSRRFLGDFETFVRSVSFYGAVNSLSQTLLKIASPGVPDFYQGADLWDLTLVDPDNRRPVDYSRRKRMLNDLRRRASHRDPLLAALLRRWQTGVVKLFAIEGALAFRRQYPTVFQSGDYLPLRASSDRRDNVIAFARRRGDDWVVVAVPRLPSRLTRAGVWPLGPEAWGDAWLRLPRGAPGSWRNVYSEAEIRATDTRLRLSDVFGSFPIALLQGC